MAVAYRQLLAIFLPTIMQIEKFYSLPLLAIAAMLSTPAIADSDWQWSVEPYFMATNIDGDFAIGRALEGPITVDTKDILETLELGGMIHIEALRSDGWGFFTDYAFMRLGDKLSGPRDGINKLTVRQGVFEGMVVRRFAKDHGVFDVYGGVRWWDNKVSLVLDLNLPDGQPEFKVNEDWVDPVVGVRYYTALNEKWTLSMQADVGGLGLASDFTFSAVAGVQYRFNNTFSLDVRYKGLWVDYEDGDTATKDYFAYDTVTHGLIVGLIIEL
jgi:hypothetical protein